MADAAPPAPRPPAPKGALMQMVGLMITFAVLFNFGGIRTILAYWAGFVLAPVFGFHGHYPVLTILLTGTVLVTATTLLRHFTTDWVAMAKFSSYQRAFMKELNQARKDNNTFKMKKLEERRGDVTAGMQEMQQKQMSMMPLTLLVSTPLYAWLYEWLTTSPDLKEWSFTAPWNPSVDFFGTNGIIPWFGHQVSIFPHYILLGMALTVPLSMVIQRSMKYLSWKERWQRRHPEVHE